MPSRAAALAAIEAGRKYTGHIRNAIRKHAYRLVRLASIHTNVRREIIMPTYHDVECILAAISEGTMSESQERDAREHACAIMDSLVEQELRLA